MWEIRENRGYRPWSRFGMRDDAYEEGYEDGYRAAMEEMGMTSYRMGERNNRR